MLPVTLRPYKWSPYELGRQGGSDLEKAVMQVRPCFLQTYGFGRRTVSVVNNQDGGT